MHVNFFKAAVSSQYLFTDLKTKKLANGLGLSISSVGDERGIHLTLRL